MASWHTRFFGWLNRHLSTPYRGFPRITRDNMHDHKSETFRIFAYAEPETIRYTKPFHLSELPAPYREQLGTVTYPQPVVLEIHNGKIRGRHAAVFTHDEQLVFESLIHREPYVNKTSFGRIHYPRSIGQLASQIFNTPRYDLICSIVNVYSEGYFHWVTEVLPRLSLIAEHRATTGQKIPILIDPDPPQWVLDSLHFLGFEDIVEWHSTFATAKKLIVPMALYTSGVPSAHATNWVSEQTKANLPEATPTFEAPRIYITRKNAKLRRVINETAVIEHLSRFDFQVFELENLTFAEQVNLFSQAEWVIAPHGAGFANLIHSNEIRMIEFFEPGYINPCFYRLACGKNFAYGFLVGEASGKDILVDVGQLAILMQKMGLSN